MTPSAARLAKPATTAAKPGDASDLMAEATRRIEEGQYAGAEAMLTQLLSREPGNPRSANYWPDASLYRVIWSWPWANIDFWPVRFLRAQDHGGRMLIADYLKAGNWPPSPCWKLLASSTRKEG